METKKRRKELRCVLAAKDHNMKRVGEKYINIINFIEICIIRRWKRK